MSSRVTIPAYARIIQQQFIPALPDYWAHLFRFGVQSLTLKPFVSLASNARQTIAHPDTASTTMDRLVGNEGLALALANVIARLGIVTPQSVLACDHSTFNGLATFMGAIQTKKGRAIPCLVETLYAQQLPATSTAPKRKQKLKASAESSRHSDLRPSGNYS